MSAFYLFHAMGLYPNAGSDVYLISGAPVFERTALHLENGKALEIERRGQGRYVRQAALDGHAEIANGARLVLEMGERPGQWGTDAPPPSLSDEASK